MFGSVSLPTWMKPSKALWLSAMLSMLCLGPAVTVLTPQPASADRSSLTRQIHSLQRSRQRWIEVNLSGQRLVAWQGNQPIYAIFISTGKSSTPTQSGVYEIQSKQRYARMRGADYDVSDVPYTMYYSGNYAIHGAYWHRRFGTPVSHGCVNVAVNHAKWLFNWASVGTPVVVH